MMQNSSVLPDQRLKLSSSGSPHDGHESVLSVLAEATA